MPAPRILIFCDYFLPGYRAGGPIRTLQAFCRLLGKSYQIQVLTRDHDLGESDRYSENECARVQRDEGIRIRYLAKRHLRVFHFFKLIRSIKHDVVYLNSLFSWRFSILYLIYYRLGLVQRVRTVLAVRGECAPAALSLKAQKKHFYLKIASFVGLYKNVIFQATNEFEKEHIESLLKKYQLQHRGILIAPNLVWDQEFAPTGLRPEKSKGELRLIFLSRISPMKNLELAIRALKKCDFSVTFDVFGPVDSEKDGDYWNQCLRESRTLPKNVKMTYRGVLAREALRKTLLNYQAMILPTRGENFGHVIIEALESGVMPVISDKTPWQDLETAGVGYVVRSEDPADYAKALGQIAQIDQGDWILVQENIQHYVKRAVERINDTNAYEKLFVAPSNLA